MTFSRFLLESGDLAWIESTFAPARVTLFDHGGHLGNLSEPAVQRGILGALDGLGSLQNKSKKEASLEFRDAPAMKLGEQNSSQSPSLIRE